MRKTLSISFVLLFGVAVCMCASGQRILDSKFFFSFQYQKEWKVHRVTDGVVNFSNKKSGIVGSVTAYKSKIGKPFDLPQFSEQGLKLFSNIGNDYRTFKFDAESDFIVKDYYNAQTKKYCRCYYATDWNYAYSIMQCSFDKGVLNSNTIVSSFKSFVPISTYPQLQWRYVLFFVFTLFLVLLFGRLTTKTIYRLRVFNKLKSVANRPTNENLKLHLSNISKKKSKYFLLIALYIAISLMAIAVAIIYDPYDYTLSFLAAIGIFLMITGVRDKGFKVPNESLSSYIPEEQHGIKLDILTTPLEASIDEDFDINI